MEENEKRDRQPTLDEELKRQKRYWKRDLICSLVVVAVVLVISLFRGNAPVISPGETQLTVQAPDGQVSYADYAEVTAVSLLDGADYGTCLEGESTGRYLYGSWESAAWGRYTLCVYAKVPACLVIESGSAGTLVVNCSSEEETNQLYELLQTCCGNPG